MIDVEATHRSDSGGAPLERLTSPQAAEAWCRARRESGARLGFVPTMGALHAGHLSLVRSAAAECDAVVVSVFVNPLQFDEAGDFHAYPRDFEGDAVQLEGEGASMAFTGSLEQFFADAPDPSSPPSVDPRPAAAGLEGEFRDGHFAGVATIVRRLFEVVRPERAYFGEKDFQQTLVVRHVARELGFPEIIVLPTSREASGLARSSRNARLTEEQRERAACLSGALFDAREAWRGGSRNAAALTRAMGERIRAAGLDLEYAALRDPHSFAELGSDPQRAQALVAARLGAVRLIDNLRLDDPQADDGSGS